MICSRFLITRPEVYVTDAAQEMSTATLQTDAIPNTFEISFDKAGPRIPCVCPQVGYIGRTSAEEERQLQVSVTTNTAVRAPLVYRYKVSGGKINGEGPTVVWDFDNLGPGEYQITVNVSDKLDPIGKSVSKTAQLSNGGGCDCPHFCPSLSVGSTFVSVRSGDRMKFKVFMPGGDLQVQRLTYHWNVWNGTIRSGQGTCEISVLVDRNTADPKVVADVTIAGLDPASNCPNVASGSVPIGKQTISQNSGPGVLGIVLDENHLVIGCPVGVKGCGAPSSPDMIIDLLLESVSSNKTSEYHYSVTAGKIIGKGTRVKWDLSGVAPGTYRIKAMEMRRGKPVGEERSARVTVVSELCNCDPACPVVSVSGPDRVIKTGESFDLIASISGGSQDRAIMYNWTISAGEIVSGQGSPNVRIQAPSTNSFKNMQVTLTIGGIDPSFNCPINATQEITIEPKSN